MILIFFSQNVTNLCWKPESLQINFVFHFILVLLVTKTCIIWHAIIWHIINTVYFIPCRDMRVIWGSIFPGVLHKTAWILNFKIHIDLQKYANYLQTKQLPSQISQVRCISYRNSFKSHILDLHLIVLPVSLIFFSRLYVPCIQLALSALRPSSRHVTV